MEKLKSPLFALLLCLTISASSALARCPGPISVQINHDKKTATSPQGRLALKTAKLLSTSSLTPEQICNFLKYSLFPFAQGASFTPKDAASFYYALALAYTNARALPQVALALKFSLDAYPTEASYQLLIGTYDALGMKTEETQAVCDYARFLVSHKKLPQALLLLKTARKKLKAPAIDLMISSILASTGDEKAKMIFQQEAIFKAKAKEEEYDHNATP